VYYEGFGTIVEAIKREKYLKGKRRSFKDKLITAKNPAWRDLSPSLLPFTGGIIL